MLRDLFQDLRLAARSFRRSPGFTAIVVLTLALGIGANTAIFSLVDAVLLRPLPVRDPGGLVLLSEPSSRGSTGGHPGIRNGRLTAFAQPLFEQLQGRKELFTGLAAENAGALTVSVQRWGAGEVAFADRSQARCVTANYFDVLGVPAAAGRTFVSDDQTAPGANAVVVLGHGYWQRRFGGDPAIVGARLMIDGRPYTVIGVAAREFRGIHLGEVTDLWVPLTMQADLMGRSLLGVADHWWLLVLGRLQPGVSRAAAGASANVLLRQYLAANNPTTAALRIGVEPGGAGFTRARKDLREPLLTLMAGVGLLLLVVCLNVSHLLLARGLQRQREWSIRTALGASRGRLARHLLAEGLLLSAAGALAGALASRWMIEGLLSFIPADVPLTLNGELDRRVLAFIAGLGLAAAGVLGLVPAWRATGDALQGGLRMGPGALGGGRPRRRVGQLLLISQVALSMVLLVGAGLLSTTLRRLRDSDKGFDEGQLLVAELGRRVTGPSAPAADFTDELLRRVGALPGVQSASLARSGPLSGRDFNQHILVSNYPSAGELFESITPGYFATMGMALVRGRSFTAAELSSKRVAVVNEAFVRRFYPQGAAAALGTTFRFDPVRDPGMPRDPVEVVGIVQDTRTTRGLNEEVRPLVYMPGGSTLRTLQVRTVAGMDPALLGRQLHATIEGGPGELTVTSFRTMRSQIERALTRERLLAVLAGAFGLAALFLVSVGLYGVVSQWAGQRTQEIGLRMAVGATAAQVRGLVLGQGFRLVLSGAAVGLPLALAAGHLLRSLLFDISPAHPPTLAAAMSLMLIVAAVGAYLPARRASRVDPMVALRSE
jgi:predicted permease